MVVVPAAIPVTVPVALTVAMAALLLVHVPPAVESLRVVVLPAHTVVAPVMAATVGAPLTVTVAVRLIAPQLVVTV